MAKKTRPRELTVAERDSLKVRIVSLLRYIPLNKNGDHYYLWHNNPVYAEAFGVLHALQVLGLGFFGACNMPIDDPHRGFNLKAWFDSLVEEEVEKKKLSNKITYPETLDRKRTSVVKVGRRNNAEPF